MLLSVTVQSTNQPFCPQQIFGYIPYHYVGHSDTVDTHNYDRQCTRDGLVRTWRICGMHFMILNSLSYQATLQNGLNHVNVLGV